MCICTPNRIVKEQMELSEIKYKIFGKKNLRGIRSQGYKNYRKFPEGKSKRQMKTGENRLEK
jgi:hypothetical protein